MFQKLYRHLEDISKSLDQSCTSAASAQGEMIDQLEAVNVTLSRVQEHLAADQKDRVTQVEPTGGNRRPADVRTANELRFSSRVGMLWLMVIAMFIPLLVFMGFNLVQINRTLSSQAAQQLVMAPSPAVARVIEPADAAGQLAAQRHLAKLDSLIAEQDQAIAELKKLNITAVATMRRIRRHFVLSEHVVKTDLAPVDSLALAR